jgi:hypothetical protein
VPLLDQVQAQRFNEGGLAHARHAADAQAEDLPGVRQQRREQFIGLRPVVGPGGFQQRDGFGNGAALGRAIGTKNARGEVHFAAIALRICSSTSLALAGIGVPGP